MKIIKKGKHKEKSTKIKCSNCKSILSFEYKDLHYDSDGDYLICPICGTIIETFGDDDN